MSRRRGFTLVELVSGIIVFSIVVATSFELTRRWGAYAAKVNSKSSALGQSRFATIRLGEDIRVARYIYHSTRVTVDAGVKVGGQSLANWLPSGGQTTIPAAWGDELRSGTLSNGLPTDVLVMMQGTMETPIFVAYMRTNGPVNPRNPTAAERDGTGLWNRMVRLSMACSGTINTATGEQFRMNVNYRTAGGPLPQHNVRFVAAATTLNGDHWTGSANAAASLTCQPTQALVLATVVPGESAADVPVYAPEGVKTLFRLLLDHPAANSNMLSPYEVAWSFMAGDPNRPALPGGNQRDSDGEPLDGVVVEGYAFARNVPLPQGGSL